MLVIGLVGGVASGKTFVAGLFGELGAGIIDADKIGHEVLNDPEVVKKIKELWPETVVSNQVCRQKLGEIVFRSSQRKSELIRLESIVHPLINQEIQRILQAFRTQHTPAVVLDAALLIRAGWSEHCDKIVFVDVPLDLRRARSRLRNWADDELEKRESSQESLQEKLKSSTDVIRNSDDKEQVKADVRQLWTRWGLPDNDN